MSQPPAVQLTASLGPGSDFGILNWSASGLTNDEGGIWEFGFIPVGVDPAPLGAGFMVVQIGVGDGNGNASGSVLLQVAGVPALPPDQRTEPINPGASFDCYLYDAATGSPQGYSNPVTIVVDSPFMLGSNSNYLMDDTCKPILSPAITISVTQAMLATNGFGFQWNAYSPQNEVCGYQQYVLVVEPGTLMLTGAVDNWPLSGNNLLNDFFEVAPLPSTSLEVGALLSMALVTDPSTGDVTACTFMYAGPGGVSVAKTLDLSTIAGFQSDYLAPITAYEMNLVGPYDAEATVLSSGAGTFAYSSAGKLEPLQVVPGCTEAQVVTAETANSVYGSLPPSPAASLVQTFGVTPTASVIRRAGHLRPSTPLRGRLPRRL